METFGLITGCETSLISSPASLETAGTARTPTIAGMALVLQTALLAKRQPPRQEMANEGRRHGLAIMTTSPELDAKDSH